MSDMWRTCNGRRRLIALLDSLASTLDDTPIVCRKRRSEWLALQGIVMSLLDRLLGEDTPDKLYEYLARWTGSGRCTVVGNQGDG